jgi:hypothetical protein
VTDLSNHPDIIRVRDRARAVDLMRKLAGSGLGLSAIADELSAACIPTLSGRPGARWRISSVQYLATAEGIDLYVDR